MTPFEYAEAAGVGFKAVRAAMKTLGIRRYVTPLTPDEVLALDNYFADRFELQLATDVREFAVELEQHTKVFE